MHHGKVSAAMNGLFRKGCVTAGAVIALAAAPASAATTAASTAATSCPSYPVFQPFLAWGDSNDYVLLPGESADTVNGTGWQLKGGARLVSTTLQDGLTGQVLDMPKGSAVITAPLCVSGSSYPAARTMIADITGKQGVAVAVGYQSLSGAWSTPLASGTVRGTGSSWAPSAAISLHSQSLTGGHYLRLALAATDGDYQLYNFYIDPRRSH
jgi:hypothetical protein